MIIVTEITHISFYLLSLQDGNQICSMDQSPHQLMYNLYNIIALTEIKGYAMLQFSYMMLKIYGKVGQLSNTKKISDFSGKFYSRSRGSQGEIQGASHREDEQHQSSFAHHV